MDTGYDCEFVDKVPEEYVCVICQLPMRKPVQTKCGHRFCRKCLLGANKRKRFLAVCPMDRQPLYMRKDEELFEDKAVERSILSLTIKCPNEGCEWQGELRNHENHSSECVYRMVKCASEYCDVEKPLIEMRVHILEECEWRQVSCPYCKKTMTSRGFEEHKKHCPEFPVECPNQCGQDIARKRANDHIDNDCPKSVVCCSYRYLGCTLEVLRENRNNHLKNDVHDHLLLVLKETTKFQDSLKQRVDLVERNAARKLQQELQIIKEKIGTQQREHKREHKREHEWLSSEIHQANEQTRVVHDEAIQKIESSVERERKYFWRVLMSVAIGTIAILAFTSRQITGTAKELTQLQEKLEIKTIWNVNKERTPVKDFYTGRYGYKLRAAALRQPRISRSKEEHFFSFAVALLRGENDAILSWPFNKIIKVTLLDQTQNPSKRKNVAVMIDPKEYQASKYSKRPTASSSIPFVFKHITLEEHLNTTDYFFEGALFLLIETQD